MKKEILIIEDEKVLGEMYQEKFIQTGFGVILVDSAEEGMKVLTKKKPDLILLDILLPKKSGISFLAKLRKSPEFASIPVIVFSNYDDPETKKQALKFKVKEYLIKTSFTPQEIIKKVEKYLE